MSKGRLFSGYDKSDLKQLKLFNEDIFSWKRLTQKNRSQQASIIRKERLVKREESQMLRELRINPYARINKIEELRNIKTAKLRDEVISNEFKSPQNINVPHPIKETFHQVGEKSIGKGETVSKVGKDTVLSNSVKHPDKYLNVKGLMNRFKGMSWKGKFMVAVGTAMGLAFFIPKTHYVRPMFISQTVGWDPRASSYLPDKYSRGYDTIKEELTDFGSRLHLAKTLKEIIPYVSSIRKGTLKTTSSVTNSCPSLWAGNHAIKHHRYQ